MESGDSSVASQKQFHVNDHQSRDSFQDHEFPSTELGVKNDLSSYDACYNLNTHEEFLHGDTSALVLDVADQIKEKLGVGIKSNRSINGCVINRENGLKTLDSYEDSIQNSVNCNKNSLDNSTELANIFSSNIVNQEKTDNKDTNCDKHCSLNTERNNLDESVHFCKPNSTGNITYVGYESELQMPDIMRLIQKDLSEPYSIYTYRYFIHNWPKLCFLAMDEEKCVGAVVCKLDLHKNVVRRGYIAMLAVDENYRKRKIGSNLVLKAIRAMVADDADEVVLETEITNKPALRLYENLGFVRDKRLFRYYLNGVDALRLKLWLR